MNQPSGDARSRLIAASKVLFLSKGLIGTSVDAIVAGAKTSKREFYKHFVDREAIFLEVARQSLLDPDTQLKSMQQRFSERASQADEENETIEGFLYRTARFLYETHLDQQSLGLFRAAIAASMLHPEVADAVYKARSHSLMEEYLEDQRSLQNLEYDDAHLTAIRFGHLATDGLRFMMGAQPISAQQQASLAQQVSELFLNGHATRWLRDNNTASPPGMAIEPPEPVAKTDLIMEAIGNSRLATTVWDRVQDVAWAEFALNGYDKASVSVIAQQANVPRNTLYRHFGSKENLFVASAGMVIDRTFGGQLNIPNGVGTVRDLLVDIALQMLRRFLSPANLALHRQLFIEAGRDPEMTARIHAYLIRKNQNMLAPVFAKLASEGMIRKEFASQSPWRFFILSTFGSRFIFVQADSPDEQKKLAEEAVDLFLYGCRREGRSSDLLISTR